MAEDSRLARLAALATLLCIEEMPAIRKDLPEQYVQPEDDGGWYVNLWTVDGRPRGLHISRYLDPRKCVFTWDEMSREPNDAEVIYAVNVVYGIAWSWGWRQSITAQCEVEELKQESIFHQEVRRWR